MSIMGATEVPPGYIPLLLEGGFGANNGDVYWRSEEKNVSFGMYIEDRHCNVVGTCHGGWIATYLDMVLPLTARFTVPDLEERVMLTVSLSIDYLDAVRSGDWLEGRASVLRKTGRLVFVDGVLMVGERAVVRGSAIFRIGPPAPKAR